MVTVVEENDPPQGRGLKTEGGQAREGRAMSVLLQVPSHLV